MDCSWAAGEERALGPELLAQVALVAVVERAVLWQLDRVVAGRRVGELEAEHGALALLAGGVLRLVDADEGELRARVVHDHRPLRVLRVRQVDAAHEDAAPVEPAEPLAAEDVERAGEHHGRGRAGVEALERRVDVRPQLDQRVVEQPVDQVGVAVRAARPALERVGE